eukprot:TRINITY_DN80519_c0_g1_i1.p1 TRINITY_DN80519_c0_g1~~TRINITY_DN80519_c0_g1_i1.p1  ORF type:complete len:549 (+),score=159.76 TRINITY_DN80519_c0_g1_i1:85-1731(+)
MLCRCWSSLIIVLTTALTSSSVAVRLGDGEAEVPRLDAETAAAIDSVRKALVSELNEITKKEKAAQTPTAVGPATAAVDPARSEARSQLVEGTKVAVNALKASDKASKASSQASSTADSAQGIIDQLVAAATGEDRSAAQATGGQAESVTAEEAEKAKILMNLVGETSAETAQKVMDRLSRAAQGKGDEAHVSADEKEKAQRILEVMGGEAKRDKAGGRGDSETTEKPCTEGCGSTTTTKAPEEFRADSCGGGSVSEPKWQCTHKDRRAKCKKDGDSEDRGCGRNQSRCDGDLFEDSRSDSGNFIPCCEKHNLQKILQFVDKTLCGKVQYSIMYGTLLAAIRDSDLIDWDTDIDIVIWEGEDKTKAQELLAENAGDFYFSKSEDVGDTAKIYWGDKNNIHADIFFLQEKGNCSMGQTEWFPTEWFKKPFDKTCFIQGRKFSCPHDGERVLDYLYGHTKERSWKDTKRGNDKGRSLHCLAPENCTEADHGFTCEKVQDSSSFLQTTDDLSDAAAARRWFPREPEWAREIRKKATSVEDRRRLEREHDRS